MKKFIRFFKIISVCFIMLLLSNSSVNIKTLEQKAYIIIADYGFDFFSWILNAGWEKIIQSAIGSPSYINATKQKQIVHEYLQITTEIEKINSEIDKIYTDPSINNQENASKQLREQLIIKTKRLSQLLPFSEAVLQSQVSQILQEYGLTMLGQPIPGVLYQVSSLPQNLVISKREKIGTQTNFILTPIAVNEASNIEQGIDKKLNVSSLVVDIGGLAAYPTMIMHTSNLEWLINTIAHEWIHLYLAQRPLGASYTTPELRTMNETTAAIAGSEISEKVIKRFYPELINKQTGTSIKHAEITNNKKISEFDFRKEMNITRVNTDALLLKGQINEAESYMESRRKLFWDNGYLIRKINQAYFAFHGSYADMPGGAAGEDPVGPAVRKLRQKSSSLKVFLESISRMTTFSELKNAIGGN